MIYGVHMGDAITKLMGLLKMNVNNQNRSNPQAVAHSSKIENSVLKEGATTKSEKPFETLLSQSLEINEPASEKNPSDSIKWMEYTIKQGDTLWSLAVKKFHVNMEDLIKDNGIVNPDIIHPGQKIRVRQFEYSQKPEEVVASWYGETYHGRTMANGKIYNMYGNTVAHKELPFGTRIELENPLTGARVKAVVTDRGPFVDGRDVDISYGLAQKLSMVEKGVGKLIMRVLG